MAVDPNLDLRPDDKRIAVIMPADQETRSLSDVIFLQNFFDQLRQRVPLRNDQRAMGTTASSPNSATAAWTKVYRAADTKLNREVPLKILASQSE